MEKLKHKETGEIIQCECKWDNEKGYTYYNPDNENETYSRDDYWVIPKEPFELFGVECDKGWNCLIEPIFKYIEEYNKDKENDFDKIHVLQVKEKYGSLRFYTDRVTEELDKMIDDAEEESYKVCEKCGSREDVGMVMGGWMYTSCLECLKKQAAKSGYPISWKSNKDGKLYWINPNGELTEFKEKMIYNF